MYSRSKLIYVLILINLCGCKLLSPSSSPQSSSFQPNQLWLDTDGKHINAHGGGVIYANGKYYWFGEKRGTSASEGVSVYSSKNLYQWKNEGLALAKADDPQSDIAHGGLMERPKVVYNAKTKQYVLWFHVELPKQGYKAARVGVAVSDKVTGPYRFVKSFRPNGNMSRDMTIYVDDDQQAYLIYSSKENYDLRIAKLQPDYLDVTTQDTLLFSQHREAPAIFKKEGQYYLITSGCTGWDANKASLHVASNLFGPWQMIKDPMRGPLANLTFGGQSTFILPVANKKDTFIFLADTWKPKNLIDSRYIWLPITFEAQAPVIQWSDAWRLEE